MGSSDPVHRSAEAAQAAGYRDVIAPPTFAVILAQECDRQLIEDPEAGIDFSRVVHGEQRFIHHRPITAGDEVLGTLSVDTVRETGGHAMVTTRTELATTDRRGPVHRDLDHRDPGRGVSMGVRTLAQTAVGDTFGPVTLPVSRETLVAYADASGDQNPIHQDEAFARSVGLPDVIAHGMWTMGAAGSVVEEWAGDGGRVVEFGTRFTKPVVVPADGGGVEVSGVVKAARRADPPRDRRADRHQWRRQGPRSLPRRRPARLMREQEGVPLADLTTMRVGGPAARLVTAETTDEVVDAVREVDDADEPLLVLSGGSNLVVSDEGFAGTVVRIASSGVAVESADACGGRDGAGRGRRGLGRRGGPRRVRGLVGIEALSGIPGCAGATPIQNVGAYGQEVAQTIASVRVWDRDEQRVRTFASADCGFTYRHSVFKAHPRYVVLDVLFQLLPTELSAPVGYADLARQLGVGVGDRVPLAEARDAVLEQRRARGMVLDADDHDTWSCGSFFTNPILRVEQFEALEARAAERLGEGGPVPPRFADPDGNVKTSAAWLIDQAGFGKGYGLPGPAALSTKHTLAITNRGGAKAADIAGPGPRDPRRGAGGLRHHPGQRARLGGPLALTRVVRRRAVSPRSRPASRRCRPGWSSCSGSGARLASTDPRARRASSSSEKPRASRALSYCAASREPKSSGSSAPSATGMPASTSSRSGTSAAVGVDPEGHVAARADLERDAALGHHRPAPGGPPTLRTPWPRRSGHRASRVVSTAAGPSSSPPCGTRASPARRAIAKARANSSVTPRRSSLDSPKPDHGPGPLARVLGGQPGQRPGVERVPHAARGHDDRHLGALLCGDGAGLVEHDLQGRGDAADERRVRRRVDLDLQPARPLGGVVLRGLAHDAAHVGLAAHAGPGGVVEALEAEPAALVGARSAAAASRSSATSGRRMPCCSARSRSVLDAHRAGEVQVQVGLGQVAAPGAACGSVCHPRGPGRGGTRPLRCLPSLPDGQPLSLVGLRRARR